MDQKAKGLSSREAAALSGGSERGSKNRVSENTTKTEDGSLGEFQVERSSSTKASPQPFVERSPSTMGLERRYINRTGTSQSLEVEETGQRKNTRDFPASEADRILVDETFQAELSNNKVNQNSTSFPPRPESRSGISSPKVAPLEEDSRANIAGRYKRGGDANMGRGLQGNMWRGSPNWSSPVIPNGFIPFQHGPPHGGFQSMMPQFPSPSLFGVRPSMEMSHSGIPYHMTDVQRFSGHMRPLGWQNMMDVSGSHMHGFFGGGVFRDGSRMYGGAEWDHNRRMHGRGWDSGVDAWKTLNVDVSMDVSSISVKDDNSAQAIDGDTLADQKSHSEDNRAKSIEAGSNLTSPAKELAVSSPKTLFKEAYVDTVAETMDTVERYCQHYLSKIDISVKLTDTEIHSQCMWLLEGEEGPTRDDGIAVFVNLKVFLSHASTSDLMFVCMYRRTAIFNTVILSLSLSLSHLILF